MGFAKKTWQNRLVEYAGRRKLTNVSTGTQQVVDVAREEGSVSQEGSAFDAANMNDLEQRISDGIKGVETQVNQMTTKITERVPTLNWNNVQHLTFTKFTVPKNGIYSICARLNGANWLFVHSNYLNSYRIMCQNQTSAPAYFSNEIIVSKGEVLTPTNGSLISEIWVYFIPFS